MGQMQIQKLKEHKVEKGHIRYEDTMTMDQDKIRDGLKRAPKGVNDGNGFIFVSHTGDVYPSGLLPIKVGNIRKNPLSHIYRTSPVLKELRNPNLYKGKCGVCEYRQICGGSRSRAYAMTGDYLASEPFCVYVPQSLRS